MLTRKQRELLLFVHRRLQSDGISPSFDEMKDALDLRSKSGVHRLITALEERGFIRRLPNRARALEVTRLPDGTAPLAAVEHDAASQERAAGLAEGAMPAYDLPQAAQIAQMARLPLYGRIAAGLPIEALADTTNFAEVPASLLGKGEHYALEIAGDSMVEAGILDGDTVIIRRTDTAENGSIVVALVDGIEATLKRLRRRGREIALEPANSAYETRLLDSDRVQVQGRLVGLIRSYH